MVDKHITNHFIGLGQNLQYELPDDLTELLASRCTCFNCNCDINCYCRYQHQAPGPTIAHVDNTTDEDDLTVDCEDGTWISATPVIHEDTNPHFLLGSPDHTWQLLHIHNFHPEITDYNSPDDTLPSSLFPEPSTADHSSDPSTDASMSASQFSIRSTSLALAGIGTLFDGPYQSFLLLQERPFASVVSSGRIARVGAVTEGVEGLAYFVTLPLWLTMEDESR